MTHHFEFRVSPMRDGALATRPANTDGYAVSPMRDGALDRGDRYDDDRHR